MSMGDTYTEKAVELPPYSQEILDGDEKSEWFSRAEELEAKLEEREDQLLQHVRALKVAREALVQIARIQVTQYDMPSAQRVHAIASSALGDIEMLVPSEREDASQ